MNLHEQESERINGHLDIITKANEGDAVAQLEIGKIYFNSTLVEMNCETAFGWIFRSADQGNREAQFRLGNLYALGLGTPKSISDAYKWYTRAAIQGYKKALIRIHNLYKEDIKVRCRGQLNSKEKEYASSQFKKENGIRELYEYRITQNQAILNGAIDYYTNQFKHYQSCNQKDPVVQLYLAFFYQHGYGFKKCTRWAFEYYTLAAEQGNIDAQYNLGDLFQHHHDMKFNYRHALKWYTKSAQGGNIAAQRSLAFFYLNGLATSVDYKNAFFWYTKAAEAGDSDAQLILGKLYRKGDYVKQDIAMAVKWYTLAAREGNSVAQNCLSQLRQRGMLGNIELEEKTTEYFTNGSMHERLCTKLSMELSKISGLPNFKELKELAKHALMADGCAMYEVGLKYYHGDKEFIQDQEAGIRWIKNAANAKHKHARLMIADLYKEGDSIVQDYHRASIWYKKVAKQKDSDAQRNVGLMYNEGLGVREDPLEASKWFTWATDQENNDAQYDLGMLRLNGRGLRQDEQEAVDWFYKSALQRNIQSCYILGDIYFYGRFDIKENTEKGLALLEFAVKNGYIDAQKKMNEIYKEGREIDQDLQKYIDCYKIAADSGNAEAQYTLATIHLHSNDHIKAYNWFKKAKNNGYKRAEWIFQTPVQCDSKIKDYSKVAYMLTKVTEDEIEDLHYHIGFIYENGVEHSRKQHIQIDYTEAKKWYLKASKKGDSRADYRLGVMHENGNGVKQNYDKALNYYRKSSRKGNGDASFKIAATYFNEYCITRDRLVPIDTDEEPVTEDLLSAFHFYRKASIMGHEESTRVLLAYKNSKETRHSSAVFLKQISMLEVATEEGFTGLYYQLGVMYEERNDDVKALNWLSLAAEIGVTDAYYKIGVFYEEGRGTDQDYTKAAGMYQKAAEKEHEDACYRLAHLYQYGKGVGLDYITAYDFYKKAADMGHFKSYKVLNITLETKTSSNNDERRHFFRTSSQKYHDSLSMCKYVAEEGNNEVQFKVGFAYEHSFPEPNYVEAYKWYFMAASSLHTEAMYHLGLLYEKGLGLRQDYHRAIQLYRQANQQNSGDALYRLAIAYHHGRGVKVDKKKAIEYYTRSAELGNPEYQCELGRLYEEGEIVEKNLLEVIKWYTKAYFQGYDNISPKLYAMYEDKPYEVFFFKRLFRILSVATVGYFRLNNLYNIDDYGGINNRLGSLYVFGNGVKKNLNTAWQFFSKAYSNHPILKIDNFFILNHRSLSISQRNNILKALEDDKVFMNQFGIEDIYKLGMIYYNGIAQTLTTAKKDKTKGYTHTDDQHHDFPSQNIVLAKDYPKAFTYLKKAADKNHIKALLQLGIMYHCGYGVMKSSEQGEACFSVAADLNIETIGYIATMYHAYEGVQDFSRAFKWYTLLKTRLSTYLTYADRKRINELIQLGLGLLYEYGDGVSRDYQEALQCYRALGSYNKTMALHRQGLMYYYGKGVSVDYNTSFKLFKEASLDSAWNGQKLLYVYDSNKVDRRSSQSSLLYLTMDHHEIIGENHYYLGLMYKTGQGTPQNKGEAQDHFKNAYQKGCKRAKHEVED